jgi:predicted membrane channel-forming protein YqfA (hemolysin III family)
VSKLQRASSTKSGLKKDKGTRRPRHHKPRGLPAIVVFLLITPIAIAGIGTVLMIGTEWIPLSVGSIILLIWMQLINDRKGFIRSREMRRAYESRRHFSIFETLIVFILIMANMLASVYVALMSTR